MEDKKLKNIITMLLKNKKITSKVYTQINNTLLKYKTVNKKKLKTKKDDTSIIKLNNKISSLIIKMNLLKGKRNKETVKSNIGIEKISFKTDVLNRLNKNRTFNEKFGVMYQHAVIDVLGLDFEEIATNIYINYVNDNIIEILEMAQKALFNKDSNIKNGDIQLHYCYSVEKHEGFGDMTEGVGFAYVKNAQPFGPDTDMKKLKYVISSDGSDLVYRIIGYRMSYVNKKKILVNGVLNNSIANKKTFHELKAFAPTNNRKFHELTTKSTTDDKICIYETYLDITNRLELKYMRHSKENKNKIRKMLKEEGKEIEDAVLNGELVNSLELLTIKYYETEHNTDIIIQFFDKTGKQEDLPLKIVNGTTIEIDGDELEEYKGWPCFIYEKNLHVSPSKVTMKTWSTQNNKEIKTSFSLRPSPIKTNKTSVGGVLGFDAETYLKSLMSNVFNLTLVGHIPNKNYNNKKKECKENEKIIKVNKSFYSLNCVEEFVNYIDEICTKINNKKARTKVKIPFIHMYGFNNSRFDNLLIYEQLYKIDPSTKYVFAGNSIKYIKYNNIRIYDISLDYKLGGLRDTSKAFKLEKEKGVYPYKFVKEDNINYIGEVPDEKYWNTRRDIDKITGKITIIKEYEEYIKKEGKENFNLKEYTEKYCLLDSELVYELALKHLESAKGEITLKDGTVKKYNVEKCPTSAGTAMKMFEQVFLEDILDQSPDNIVTKEKNAYKGGRTEVFKKQFELFDKKSHKRLYYFDINSAHPSGMTKMMPFKYLKTMQYDNTVFKIDDLSDCDLYLSKIIYIGNNNNFISNILIRVLEGDIISTKNTEYDYHWGIELKEAIKNNCEVTVKECNMYEEKAIFKVFAEYFYEERLKVKKTNEALAMFFKNVLNSLYGKFGQKKFTHTCLCKNSEEMYNILGDDSKLISFEVIKENMLIEYEMAGDEHECIGKLVRFASYITATTRSKLSEFMRDVGHENVYYCDTDSVFTSKKPSKSFIDENKLGKWKLECKPIIKAIFLAPKTYFFETEDNYIVRKAKGVDSKRIEESEYKDMVDGKKQFICQESDMFHRSLKYGVKIELQERNISPVYNKRIWVENDSISFLNVEEWRKSKEL